MDQLEKKEIDTSRGIHYRYFVSPASTADSSKPTIVLCHGWPDSAELWQFVIPQLLQTKCRLVAPDLLGSGGSSKPTDPAAFQIQLMVNDMMEMLKVEGIQDKIIPLGHDWGSYFAQRLYMLNKSKMSGLITLNVSYMAPRAEPFDLDAMNAQTTKAVGYPIYAYWELFADPEVGKVMDPNLESVWYACHGDSDKNWMLQLFCSPGEMRKFISAGRTDVPLKEYGKNSALKQSWINEKKSDGMTSQCAWYRAMKEGHHAPTEKVLSESESDWKVTTPYLFVGCDGDAVCLTGFIEMAKQAGAVTDELLTVKELHSGHWCPYEKPEEVAEAVVEWLGKEGFI
ncbi:Bifunctional epoxide hydrolase 2 [Pseudocercospora fuligena]|uniref:Bifunctional epoxide hydrolase 2 n=1 Tax=Pseudocercospora fuligena TaxID=685502 RepID=A0A8H6RL17_9PEZI|nr:Bifunctional epoxide hydrolase 2 [Pseudocercospora fuligena]